MNTLVNTIKETVKIDSPIYKALTLKGSTLGTGIYSSVTLNVSITTKSDIFDSDGNLVSSSNVTFVANTPQYFDIQRENYTQILHGVKYNYVSHTNNGVNLDDLAFCTNITNISETSNKYTYGNIENLYRLVALTAINVVSATNVTGDIVTLAKNMAKLRNSGSLYIYAKNSKVTINGSTVTTDKKITFNDGEYTITTV